MVEFRIGDKVIPRTDEKDRPEATVDRGLGRVPLAG